MASINLARGLPIQNCPDEITYFLLAKEFHWTPSQIKRESYKDMKGLMTILSNYNKVKNAEMDRISGKGSSGAGGMGGFMKGGKQTVDITDPKVEKELEQKYGRN